MPETSARELIHEIGTAARRASRITACASTEKKNAALERMAQALMTRRDVIQAANAVDLANARSEGLSAAFVDRLAVTDRVLDQMVTGVRQIAELADPVGGIENLRPMPSGIRVGRMRVPLGVIAMIYEARPNVTVDAAILCLKAGNAVILRGGREALNSNRFLASLLQQALREAGLPEDAAQLVQTTDHAAVTALCKLDEYIDVMIPRGGEGLVRAVTEAATMPVLKHFKGVCHCYVDSAADLSMALNIVYNGKVQRPGVCNALECVLVHKDVAEKFLPMMAEKLGEAGVEFRCCPRSLPLMGPAAKAAQDSDWGMEFHALILAVKVVDSPDDALAHIARYNSNHTDVIVTNDLAKAMHFVRACDSSMVGVNVSTRMNDGGQLGLGAEIGISTSKLHAYGPMGVMELTTSKFVVLGSGQVRS